MMTKIKEWENNKELDRAEETGQRAFAGLLLPNGFGPNIRGLQRPRSGHAVVVRHAHSSGGGWHDNWFTLLC